MTTLTIEPHLLDPSFLAGTKFQWNWSANSLSLLKRCPRKYQLKKIEQWQGKGTSVHLFFGGEYHKALENYDIFKAKGLDHEESLLWVVHYLFSATAAWESDHSAKNRETLFRSVIWYLEQFKDDAAKTLILSNGNPAVELPFQFISALEAVPGTNFAVSGIIDRLVKFAEDTFIVDRKTTGSTLSSYYFDQFNPDNQMTLYTLAGRIVYNMPVSGVIIDAAQIAVGFTRFDRGITLRSEAQLDEWMLDFDFWMETNRRYVEQDYWPMNETACGDYGGCEFRGICSKDPAVRALYLKTDFTQGRH